MRRKTTKTRAPRVAGPRPRNTDQVSQQPAIRFKAPLLVPRQAGKPVTWNFLLLPKAASLALPSRGQTTIRGTLNDHPFQATLEPDGKGGHWLKVDRKLLKAAGVEAGDAVTLEVTPVEKEPEPKVPADLRKALADALQAKAVWADITPVARRDWIQWITSGKRAETRSIRIQKACDMLAKGKRRICCFDRSGMYSNGLSCPEAEPAAPAPRRAGS